MRRDDGSGGDEEEREVRIIPSGIRRRFRLYTYLGAGPHSGDAMLFDLLPPRRRVLVPHTHPAGR